MESRLTLTLTAEERLGVALERPEPLALTLAAPVTAKETDYEALRNKPRINQVVLTGDRTLAELGAQAAGEYADQALTNTEIEALLGAFVG